MVLYLDALCIQFRADVYKDIFIDTLKPSTATGRQSKINKETFASTLLFDFLVLLTSIIFRRPYFSRYINRMIRYYLYAQVLKLVIVLYYLLLCFIGTYVLTLFTGVDGALIC